jgi:hypothetical protein
MPSDGQSLAMLADRIGAIRHAPRLAPAQLIAGHTASHRRKAIGGVRARCCLSRSGDNFLVAFSCKGRDLSSFASSRVWDRRQLLQWIEQIMEFVNCRAAGCELVRRPDIRMRMLYSGTLMDSRSV